jgi:hypothetical protein
MASYRLLDRSNYNEFEMALSQGGYGALKACDRVLEIDTIEFDAIDYFKV